MILINLKIPVKAERVDEWLALAAKYRSDVTAEPGNRFFEWYRSTDDPNLFIAIEGFENADAGRAHMKTDHVAQFMAVAPDFVAAQPDIIYIDSADITGFNPMGEIKPR